MTQPRGARTIFTQMPDTHRALCFVCRRFVVVHHKNQVAAAESAKHHSTMMKGAANTMLQGSTSTPEAWIKAAMGTYHSQQLHSNASGGSGRTPAATASASLATPISDMTNHISTGSPAFQSHHRMFEFGKSDCSTQESWFRGNGATGHAAAAHSMAHHSNTVSLDAMKAAVTTPLFRDIVTLQTMNAMSVGTSAAFTVGRDMPYPFMNDAKAAQASLHLQLLRQHAQLLQERANPTEGLAMSQQSGAQTTVSVGNSVRCGSSYNNATMTMLLNAARMKCIDTPPSTMSCLSRSNNAPEQSSSLRLFQYLQGQASSVANTGEMYSHIDSLGPQRANRYAAMVTTPYHNMRMAQNKRPFERLMPALSQNELAPPRPETGSDSAIRARRRNAIHLPAPLFCSTDVNKLSPVQLLLRQQIEAFQATEADVTTQVRGRNKTIRLGQVGLRCRHCAALPLLMRGKGSTYFPTSVWGFYQAAQNMCVMHFQNDVCHALPSSVQTSIDALMASKKEQKGSNSGGGRAYWASTAQEMGLVDMQEGVFHIGNLPKDVSLPETAGGPGVYRVPPAKKRKVQEKRV